MSVCACVFACFSCGDVGQLFCRVEQQVDSAVSILNKVKYDNDLSLEKLEEILAHLRGHCIAEHFRQFVFSLVSVLLNSSGTTCSTPQCHVCCTWPNTGIGRLQAAVGMDNLC